MAKLICSVCGKTFPTNYKGFTCECGGILDLEFEAEFPIEKIEKRKPNMWRYLEAIPIADNRHLITFDEGFTPLLPIDFSGKTVFVKQDHLFQTGSYKDRGAAVLLNHAKEIGITKVVEDSSGNAGCAIAAYCAKASIKCDIFVPFETSPAKIAQIKAYGAEIHEVKFTREDTANAALNMAKETYYASHVYNPYFFHGVKTFSYEVTEQLGWKAPDTIVIPVGNGTLLLGAYIGFQDLRKAEIIEKMPKIVAVQAQNCAPLAKNFEGVSSSKIIFRKTIAEGIAIANPARKAQIMKAVSDTEGRFLTVSEKEIKDAIKEMAMQGYYIEPTSAATVAGLKKYVRNAQKREKIVSVFTGHGLKSANLSF
ncbi:threonine synthase [Athalassotoga sp.]|uniref:threonine synthase n=1 Tax=Athalassotoga sp. TaxID=2022597 RepID=UPI003D008B80